MLFSYILASSHFFLHERMEEELADPFPEITLTGTITPRRILVPVHWKSNPGLGDRLTFSLLYPPHTSVTQSPLHTPHLKNYSQKSRTTSNTDKMNMSNRLFSRLSANAPKQAARQFSRSSRRAANPAGPQPNGGAKGQARPTMEQLRAPFKRDNQTVA